MPHSSQESQCLQVDPKVTSLQATVKSQSSQVVPKVTISHSPQVMVPQQTTKPLAHSHICIGDICVFKIHNIWKIGKVLQFSYKDGKTLKARQCNETSLNITTVSKRVAVVCSWFHWYPPLSTNTFSICYGGDLSQSCLLNDYILTLSSDCLQSVQLETAAENAPKGILRSDSAKHKLACAKLISLSDEAIVCIEKTVHNLDKVDLTGASEVTEENDVETWKKYGCYRLTTTHKYHLCNDHLLTDIHMGAAKN